MNVLNYKIVVMPSELKVVDNNRWSLRENSHERLTLHIYYVESFLQMILYVLCNSELELPTKTAKARPFTKINIPTNIRTIQFNS